MSGSELSRFHEGIVLVTGASSGMGRDAALYLNELGHKVVAGIRKPADGERLVADAQRPDALHPVRLDVTEPEDVASARGLVEQLAPAGQGLTALFSNAGIAAFDGDVSCEGCPIETQQRVMNINFFGAVRVVQAFLPLLRTARGTIVVNSALMTHTVIPFNGGYAASKSALEAWADSLRREVRPHGIRVVIVRPAGVATGMAAKQDPSKVPADTPYPAQVGMVEDFVRTQQKFARKPSWSPRRVSEIVANEIVANRPHTRRIVGGGAKAVYAVGCLPDRAQDILLGLMVKRLVRR